MLETEQQPSHNLQAARIDHPALCRLILNRKGKMEITKKKNDLYSKECQDFSDA